MEHLNDRNAKTDAVEDFPRRKSRTLRFTCGAPRSARLVADGSRALFLRSDGPEDLVTSLWMSCVGPCEGSDSAGNVRADDGGVEDFVGAATCHREYLLADPRELLANADGEDVPAEELARRERSREGGQGIVSYSADSNGERVVFTINGQLFLTQIDPDCRGSSTRQLATDTLNIDHPQWLPVLNPRLSPDGRHVVYTTGERLVLVDIDGSTDTSGFGSIDHAGPDDGLDETSRSGFCRDRVSRIASVGDMARQIAGHDPEDDDSWKIGLAEFVAGEEMDRYEGFWWSPDSKSLIFETFDSSPEPIWYISDPANPERPAHSRRYAQALTKNARVYLAEATLQFNAEGSYGSCSLTDVGWERESYEYLAAVSWTAGNRPIILVQNRRQTRDQVLQIGATGSTTLMESHSNDQWLDIILGLPALTTNGTLISASNDMQADTNRLTANGQPFTPVGWQIRQVLDVGDKDVLAVASNDPRTCATVIFPLDGSRPQVLSPEPGVWTGARCGEHVFLSGRTMQSARTTTTHDGCAIANHAAEPGFTPNTRFVQLGTLKLLTAITYPSPESPYATASKLPILLKPYGGPGHQEVMFSQAYYWDAQWWADQGFLVVTADGRGTTGRGPRWDRAIFGDMKAVSLADQVEVVEALSGPETLADSERVAMIGWSYGGFLSALAVLEAPDVVHAACAGAPPTDWTLYDTHYTERYLGLEPEVYERNSIIKDAPHLRRPLMLIHGFADDNVTIANSLRLSQALMEAGRDHTFLPLTGITHMTNNESVARNLLIMQRDFLYDALDIKPIREGKA